MKAHLQSVEKFTIFDIDGKLHYCRAIPEHQGYYASTLGDIVSTRQNSPKILKPDDNRSGYLRVILSVEGTTVRHYVHRLVAAAFFNSPDADPNGNVRVQINHIDSNRSNNRVSNLEWSSRSENMLHAFKMAEVRDAQI